MAFWLPWPALLAQYSLPPGSHKVDLCSLPSLHSSGSLWSVKWTFTTYYTPATYLCCHFSPKRTRSITTNKASGGDGIPVELFQTLKDDAVKVLLSICQQIRKTQQWPQDWKMSVFILIPKKGNAKECSNYHTIALISHASKVMLKILQARLQQYVNHDLTDVQAGFRKGRGTTDQIANIHWIIEKAREFQKNIYFCFIEYTKAFDCVDHHKLWKILKEMGIPDYLTCLLRNLYAGQEATVRNGHGTTDWFQMRKGVHQGCILSP